MYNPKICIYVDFFSNDKRCLDIVEDQVNHLSATLGWDCYINTTSRENNTSWNEAIQEFINDNSKYDYIFVWFDDLYINDLADFTARANDYLNEMNHRDFDYIRLTGKPPAIGAQVIKGIRKISTNESYQCSLVGSLWKLPYLNQMLDASESPWSIERFKHNGNACSATKVTKIKNYYIKGAKNIWHYPGNIFDYSYRDYKVSIPWGVKRLVRVLLSKMPALYHKVYAK